MSRLPDVHHSIDLAAKSPGSMSIDRLEPFLFDLLEQPEWRSVADIEADYYDGNQLTSQEIATAAELGLAPSITNLIKPTIDLVLGMEAKSRRDWKVDPENSLGKQGQDIADALTERLKTSARLSRADQAIAEAYKHQAGVGLGWVGLRRPMDPFGPRVAVCFVHRREMWWDWQAQKPDLSDARYLIRRKWYDQDVLEAIFPKNKDLIDFACNGGHQNAAWDWSRVELNPLMARIWEIDRDTTIEDLEWRDTYRSRGQLYEVWYRRIERGLVIALKDDRIIEFDANNRKHLQYAYITGTAPFEAVFPRIRLSWWLGPHRLVDVPNPNPFNRFPYVPFWGFREDRTGVPYGLIRGMKYPQDEVNARMRKMIWLLSAKRVIYDNDALGISNKTKDQVLSEVARPDAAIELNANRTNKNESAFRVEADLALNQQQFQVLLESGKRIQDTAGVYQEQLGKGQTGQSGIAISQLVEQGNQTLGELNDNYADARRDVGEMLLAYEVEDLSKKNNIPVTVGSGADRRKVILNYYEAPKPGEAFKPRTNDVTTFRSRVALSDVPKSDTFRQLQFQQMGELVKALPEALQVPIIHMVVEASDYPNKDKIADALRKAAGVTADPDLDDMTDEERAAFQEQQQKAAAKQAMIEQVEIKSLMAQLEKLNAEVAKLMADAELSKAKGLEIKEELDIKADEHAMNIHERGMKGRIEENSENENMS